MGLCAEKPTLKKTKNGTSMAVLVIYTQEITKKEPINQAHRCVFFGASAENITKLATKGRHIHVRGALRTKLKETGKLRYYITSILVEEFRLSPRQSVESLKDMLENMIQENNITRCDELGIFHR